MTHAVDLCCLFLCGASHVAPASEGFPRELCDFVVECHEAESLFEGVGSELVLDDMFTIMLGVEFTIDRVAVDEYDEGALIDALLSSGTLGGRVDEVTGEVEWVGWIAATPDTAHQLMADMRPKRQLDRLVIPKLGLAIAQVGGGILVSSEPPGSLRAKAMESLARMKQQPHAGDATVPVVATFRHAPGIGAVSGTPGTSTVALDQQDGSLLIEYSGRFLDDVVQQPCCQRRLDAEVLQRLPESMIAVFVEHADADILPGASFLDRLFPQLVEPEPPDERWARRVVAVGEAKGGGSDLRLPSIAIAIETDGPGASARRQDLAVLAALNSLRNRLGTKAGLQHLPSLSDLPDTGTRTVYARALFDPALQGHPIAREISINWCVARGGSNWHLYATCPDLAATLKHALTMPASEVACVSAAHVGRLDAERAVEHLETWGKMAQPFVGNDQIVDFASSLELVTGMLSEADAIEWSIRVPDSRAIDASIRLWPRAQNGAAR